MLEHIKSCVNGEQKSLIAGGMGAILGFGAGVTVPSVGGLLSIGPLLLGAVCLLPCLTPLLLFRRHSRTDPSALTRRVPPVDTGADRPAR